MPQLQAHKLMTSESWSVVMHRIFNTNL